jgi:hypothetical protein
MPSWVHNTLAAIAGFMSGFVFGGVLGSGVAALAIFGAHA